MRNSTRLTTKLLFLLLTLCFLSTPAAAKNKKSSKSQWSANMQATFQVFNQLLPYVYNEEAFSNQKNKKKIETLIKNFSSSSASLSEHIAKDAIGDDPYLFSNLSDLKDLSKRSLKAFNSGNHTYAQRLLKSTANLCFSCHTRLPSGKKNIFWSQLKVENFNISPEQKTNLYVAMRKYPKALEHIKNNLNKSNSKTHDYGKDERLIKKYLFITLRGMSSPQRAYDFLGSQKKNKNLSPYFKERMISWRKDLVYWKKNSNKLKSNSVPLNKIITINKEDELISVGEKDFIKKLVATRTIHSKLSYPISKKMKAQQYFYLGQLYNYLIDGSPWELPEVYFESCIKYAPKSPLAKKCLQHYKRTVTLSYTGSRGTDIPNFVRQKIKQLEKKAL